ncbi:hypothetical protein HC864_01040 [Candidatus Gracilibacteria bacterium]|nr:hypothetical protein [Candidatus Gracilibacteria bacterium]
MGKVWGRFFLFCLVTLLVRLFGTRGILWIGWGSKSFIHGEVLRLVDRVLGGGWFGSLVVLPVSLVVAFVLSLITYNFVEVRFLKKAQK